ncbi:MAG: hypothetical protein PHY45_11135 [Rhodocyclaceae bacterium]|nr:hypothetical protein [Rhodocyclaceae bacterium]
MSRPGGRTFSILEHFGAAYAAIVLSIVGINVADKPVEKPKAVSSRAAMESATESSSASLSAPATDAGSPPSQN